MRIALALLVLLIGGCTFFDTPCDTVARSICRLPAEAKSCAFLRDVPRSDQTTQQICEQLVPVAEQYADNPSLITRNKWRMARAALAVAGFVDEFEQEDPDRFGPAGRAARQAAEALDAATRRTNEQIEEAFRNARE